MNDGRATSVAPLLLRARWVFPVDQPVIEDGVVEIQGDRISGLRSGPCPDAVDLGDVAIVPGLINAHTHLEFSHLTQPLQPPDPFEEWIRSVVDERRQRQRPVEAIVRDGLNESARSGTTLVGEIATSSASADCIDESTPRAVVFREVLGLDESTIEQRRTDVERHLGDSDGDAVRGLSPHAPYSVHSELFQWTLDRARRAGAPVAMHLAETRGERELLERGTGPLAEMLRRFGLWQEGLFGDGDFMDYLKPLAELDRALIVHGNYLDAGEIEFLAAHPQLSVVFCPRTHAYFRHDAHPWRSLLDAGVLVALGTDSRASNPDLNLWREVQFLRRSAPDVSDEVLLQTATINGAKALGLDSECGSLTPGKWADLAVVDVADVRSSLSVSSAGRGLLEQGRRVVATMRGGRWLSGPPLP